MMSDFRLSEREYRMQTEASVAGSAHLASAGDNISRMVGSSHPQAIGNFMRANGLTNDRLESGRNYFVPDSVTAYGESSPLGRFALNQSNERLSALAAARVQSAAASSVGADGMRSGPTVERSQAMVLSSTPSTAAPMFSDAELRARIQAKIDAGPSVAVWDVASEARAVIDAQRTRNNIAMAAGGQLVGAPMAAARLGTAPS